MNPEPTTADHVEVTVAPAAAGGAPVPPAVDRRSALRWASAAGVAGIVGAVAGGSPANADVAEPVLASRTTKTDDTTALTMASTVDVGFAAGPDGMVMPFPLGDRAAIMGFLDTPGAAAVAGVAYGEESVGFYGQGDGHGVVGVSARRGAFFKGDVAAMSLGATLPTGQLPSSNGRRGDVVFGVDGTLWLCVDEGPLRWRVLAGAETTNALRVLPAPYRAYDSRAGNAPTTVQKGKIQAGQTRVIDLDVGAPLASGAIPVTAALVNVTVTDTSASGWLALYKAGIPYPGTSTINWSSANQIVANMVTVAVDASMRIAVRASSSTHFVVDVTGVY